MKSVDTADDKWRVGRIERIALGQSLENISVRECVSPLHANEIENKRFAVVHYRQGRWSKYRTVALPADSTMKVYDVVHINISDCSAPLIPVNDTAD